MRKVGTSSNLRVWPQALLESTQRPTLKSSMQIAKATSKAPVGAVSKITISKPGAVLLPICRCWDFPWNIDFSHGATDPLGGINEYQWILGTSLQWPSWPSKLECYLGFPWFSMDKKSAPDISGSWSPPWIPMGDESLTAKSNPHNARDSESQPRSMVHKENDE